MDSADIYRAANQLLERYGSAANLYALERADELLDAGDLEGSRTWRRVIIAIGVIQPGHNAPRAN